MTYEDVPVSLKERRAEKSQDGTLWSPRDALISLLRDIDKGKLSPTDVVICYREEHATGAGRTRFAAAGPGGLVTSLGMMARVSFTMQEKD